MSLSEHSRTEGQEKDPFEGLTLREYAFNPLKMSPVSEKPTKHDPALLVRTLHEIGLENTARNLPNVSEDIKGKISTLGATPLQKFDYPCTGNMEYGWMHQETTQSPGSRSWNQPRNRCAETKFASKYYKLLKVSPFAKEQTPQSSP